MEDKIDAVILFVDMNDEEWRKGYNEYIETHEVPIPTINNVEVRSRDYGTLKCLLRSIDKNIKWINKIHLVVQRDSQVPKWVNRDTVNIVLHEDIIPKEYLPVYNAFTISIHVHRIKNLSEKFLIFSDDSIITNEMRKEDFFINNKLVTSIRSTSINFMSGSSSKDSHYFKSNSSNVAKMLCGIKDNEYYYYDFHGVRPMFKSLMEFVYNKLDIKKYVSAFRQRHNIYINVFNIYAFLKRMIILRTPDIGYIDFKNRDINFIRKWVKKHQQKQQLSINDQDLKEEFDKELYYKMVEETLHQLFPNKSEKYEI
jgi:hypothetical protein